MRRPSLEADYLWGLVVVLALVTVHAPLSVWVGHIAPEFSEPIKIWKEIILAAALVVAVVVVGKRNAWQEVIRDRLLQLAALFATIHLVLAVAIGGEFRSVLAGLLIDLRFALVFVLAYVLIRLRPDYISRLLRAVVIGAVIVVGFGILQVTVLPDNILSSLGYSKQTISPFTTIDRNPDFVRINSTLRGPNPLGALMVIYVALALAYFVRKNGLSTKRRALTVLAVLSSTAVLYASYSRSAYVALAAAVVAVLATVHRTSKRIIGFAAGIVAIGAISLILVSSSDWFSNVVLHEDPESTVMTKSNEQHIESLGDGAARVLRQPFGAGVGSTGSASLYDSDARNDLIIENNYFFVAHESGWVGLAVFMALYAGILVRLWHERARWLATGLFASGIGLGLIGLLLPVWVDETVALTWWGLAGAVVATSGIIKGTHGKRTHK